MTAVSNEPIVQLWPLSDGSPLSDDDLVELYAVDRPGIRVNFVSSADGAASVDGYSAALGSPSDKRIFDLLRVVADAVMVGAGTLRQEGYGPMVLPDEHAARRVARGASAHPPLVIVSARLDLDPSHPMFAAAPVRPVVVTHAASPTDRRAVLSEVADVLTCGESQVDFPAVVKQLADRGLESVLSEGGPSVLGALTAADVVAELCLTLSASLAGAGAGRITSGAPSAPRSLALTHALTARNDLFLRYARRP